MTEKLRVVVVDDERPARSFLTSMLRGFDDVALVGEAASGSEAVALIERGEPDLAFLDLQMPELDGMGVVRALRARHLAPLVAFVTAYDEYAIAAFEINALDYLLKPVEGARLRETLDRAKERLEHGELPAEQLSRAEAAEEMYATSVRQQYLDRIPVRRRDEVILLPIAQVAYVTAERELLHVITARGERHTIAYRLKDLETRLDPKRFIRLGRGTLANLDMIAKINMMPGGTYVAVLNTGKQLQVSRLQSRILRERLLKL
ncbi:MAG TPA: response regulator [Vicinamibacterales bacterium]|nr:response regulator [Vicinamibacterales bacterium]